MTKLASDPLPLYFTTGKRWYVYLYRDPRPRKKLEPIYVGKGTARWNRADYHWNGYGHNRFLTRILSKIREIGLHPFIDIIAGFDDENDAFKLEAALIKQYWRRNLGLGPLCNLTDGGDGGTSGYIATEETRAKLAVASAGRSHSPETRAKLSARMTMTLRSPEKRRKCLDALKSPLALANIAEANRRKGKSPEFREKLSAARLNGKITIDIILREYDAGDSLTSIARRYGVDPHTVCKLFKGAGGKPRQFPDQQTRAKISKACQNRGKK